MKINNIHPIPWHLVKNLLFWRGERRLAFHIINLLHDCDRQKNKYHLNNWANVTYFSLLITYSFLTIASGQSTKKHSPKSRDFSRGTSEELQTVFRYSSNCTESRQSTHPKERGHSEFISTTWTAAVLLSASCVEKSTTSSMHTGPTPHWSSSHLHCTLYGTIPIRLSTVFSCDSTHSRSPRWSQFGSSGAPRTTRQGKAVKDGNTIITKTITDYFFFIYHHHHHHVLFLLALINRASLNTYIHVRIRACENEKTQRNLFHLFLVYFAKLLSVKLSKRHAFNGHGSNHFACCIPPGRLDDEQI